MGSLPNLTAIGRKSDESLYAPRHYCRTGSHCSGEDEYQLTHRPLRATRSAGSNKQYSVNQPLDAVNAKLLSQFKESAFSPLSTRSSCQHSHHHHRHHPHIQHPLVTNISKQHHRDSMSTSGGSTIGTSSVKRLINVVRSTQPNIGPVYSSKKLCKNFTALCLGHAMITAALIPLYTLQSSLSIWGGSYALGRSNFNIHDTHLWNNHEPHVHYINNQSIWKESDGRHDVNLYASEDDGSSREDVIEDKERVRSKRKINHMNEDSTETDFDNHHSLVDETVYSYWKQKYKGNINQTYARVKYKGQNETNTNISEKQISDTIKFKGKVIHKIERTDIESNIKIPKNIKNYNKNEIKQKRSDKNNKLYQETNAQVPINEKSLPNAEDVLVLSDKNAIEHSQILTVRNTTENNEFRSKNISKRNKIYTYDEVRLPKLTSNVVKRNQIAASKLTDRTEILSTLHNETYDGNDDDRLDSDEDVYRTIHNVDNGSLLLALLFFMGALSTIYAPFYVRRFGIKSCFIQCYVILSLFISSHYFPNVYILAVTYSIFGLFIGILSQAKIQFLMTLANKFSMVLANTNEDFLTAQSMMLQQLLRLYVLSQDIGVMLGGILTFTVLYTNLKDYNIDYLFQYKDSGEKVCGSSYCPVIWSYLPEIEEDHVDVRTDLSDILTAATNETHIDRVNNFLTSISYTMLPCKANSLLLSIYLGFTIISVILSIIFIDRIKNSFNFKAPGVKRLRICSIYSTYFRYVEMAVKDSKLQLTAPLSLFIGLEQGFMYSDFMKSYVSCVIGTVNIPLVLLSSSVLQSVAAFTLSMLLQHVKRLYVMMVGFAFHSCLILVLVVWLPAEDDAALLYVISSAWGVCNSIWNSLVFNVLFDLYPEYWQGPFAHSYFFRYLGLALSFGLHECVCNSVKFYALTLSLLLSVTAFACLELNIKTVKRTEFSPLPPVLTQPVH